MLLIETLVIISVAIYSIVAVRFLFASIKSRSASGISSEITERRILTVIPFRNEEKIIQHTLHNVIREVKNDKNCKLILVDSASSDNGAELAQNILEESELEDNNWKLIVSEKPGKGLALNAGMADLFADDIVMMIDADALVSENSFQRIRKWLENEEIGAVSAQEQILPGSFMSEYKIRSNILRNYESSLGSTPMLEGSQLAWDPYRIGWKSFDERNNADDLQVSLCSIRSGHRSVVDSKLTYLDVRKPVSQEFSKFVRRSQGINQQLCSNLDLIFRKNTSSLRYTLISNLLLHTVMPWCTVVLLAAPFFFPIWQINPENTNSIILTFLPSFLLVASQLFPIGRSLTTGSAATIIGQFRALLGRQNSHWNPRGD